MAWKPPGTCTAAGTQLVEIAVSERGDKQREIAEFERMEAERELARAESTDEPELHLRLASALLLQARVHETLAASYDREDDPSQ
jgi:hypothetical protein